MGMFAVTRPRVFRKIKGGTIIRTNERLSDEKEIKFQAQENHFFGHHIQVFLPYKKGGETLYVLKSEVDLEYNQEHKPTLPGVGVSI